MAKDWKNKVDPTLRTHLDLQISESLKHRRAYKLSKNVSNAQLWCAIANLSKQMFELNLKQVYLEKALRELMKEKKIEPNSKKPKQATIKKTLKKF